MEQIGVRELRQHASRYLSRVANGETIEVTDRGRPVARLSPIVLDRWEEMIASGQLIPAVDDTPFSDEPALEFDFPLSENLVRQRDDER
jgi:prevent-host-death family protein